MCTDSPSDSAHSSEAGQETLRSAGWEKRGVLGLAVDWIYLICEA